MSTIPAALTSHLLDPDFAPQRAFAFPADRWRAWVGGIAGVDTVLESLPPQLDRRDASRLVEPLLPGNVAGAFVVAMIWGHGASGYGPYRTATVLTGARSPRGADASPSVLDRLSRSVEVARTEGAVEGYRYLNNTPGKVKGLGPAFFTKWLYFVTARGDAGSSTAAPVLDALVLDWLSVHAGLSLRPGYTDDYARYVEALTAWGAPHSLTPAQVEERVFRLIRGGQD